MRLGNVKSIFKSMIRFLMGFSCIFFAVRAFTIAPIAPNAVIFIKSIFLTKSGTNTSTTGIVLEGSGGHAWFQGSVTLANLPNATVLGTDQYGKIIDSAAGGGGGLGESLRAEETGTNNIYNKNYATGYVGVGLTGPTQPLQVYGNIIGGNKTNTVIGIYSNVIGGDDNHIENDLSHIGGGKGNVVKNKVSSIVGGERNTIEGTYSSIVGGILHNIYGIGNFIGGGQDNNIKPSGEIVTPTNYSFIGGGAGHDIDGEYSVIVGGGLEGERDVFFGNTINGNLGFIGGGARNIINQPGANNYSTIAGGSLNSIQGNKYYDAIVGGYRNSITGGYSFIGGGSGNYINCTDGKGVIFDCRSSIAGGNGNSINDGIYQFIGGGQKNVLTGGSSHSSIMGGNTNTMINARNSAILGGRDNTVVGINDVRNSVIAGGSSNNIVGNLGIFNSFVAGTGGSISHSYTFLRNSDPTTTFASARPNTFIINAPFDANKPSLYGGVGINTANPREALEVSGNVIANDYQVASGSTVYIGQTMLINVMESDGVTPCSLEFHGGILTNTDCSFSSI